MTKQRKLILSIVNESDSHLTAEEIFIEAKRRINSIAFATIYNNLNVLVNEKYITRVKSPGNPDRFDKETMPHEHVICDYCGNIMDVHVPEIKAMLEKRLKLSLTSFSLDMHYVCETCKQN
jgi:Fe2+ or Zn2+ uptake regulation protein